MSGSNASIFTVDAKIYNIVDSQFYSVKEFDWDDEVYYEEDDNYIYLISDRYDGAIVKINKTLDNLEINEILFDELNDTEKEWVKKYTGIWTLEENYDTEKDKVIEYPVFVTDYADGYIYGYASSFYYIVDGTVKWSKKIDSSFIKDAIQLGNNLIITYVDNVDSTDSSLSSNSYLEIYDVNGNSLGKDLIANYINKEALYFQPEHLVAVGKTGFALTGSEQFKKTTDAVGSSVVGALENQTSEMKPGKKPDKKPDKKPKPGEEPPQRYDGELADDKNVVQAGSGENDYPLSSQVLYFNIVHEVITKTDGNGAVNATKANAYWGDAIEFTITPNEGYVLGEVKVTDANGNVITFTDNKFIMPNSDVTIEATFLPENPETVVFISASIVVVLGISGFVLYKARNKLKN